MTAACVQLAVSKALGYAIIAGAVGLKLPQIKCVLDHTVFTNAVSFPSHPRPTPTSFSNPLNTPNTLNRNIIAAGNVEGMVGVWELWSCPFQ